VVIQDTMVAKKADIVLAVKVREVPRNFKSGQKLAMRAEELIDAKCSLLTYITCNFFCRASISRLACNLGGGGEGGKRTRLDCWLPCRTAPWRSR
jgi:hypothetical protein